MAFIHFKGTSFTDDELLADSEEDSHTLNSEKGEIEEDISMESAEGGKKEDDIETEDIVMENNNNVAA